MIPAAAAGRMAGVDCTFISKTLKNKKKYVFIYKEKGLRLWEKGVILNTV